MQGWKLGIDAGGRGAEGIGGNSTAALGERVLVAIPFYLNKDGSGGYTSGSVSHTRTLYFNATYFSTSRLFPNVVAFVANENDLTYCRNESGLPFRDVVHIRGLSKGTELPMATLLEIQRRFRTNHGGWRDKYDWIYYTESDQVMRYRANQLEELLRLVPSGANDAVLVPHRMATWPTSLEFADFPGNLSDATAERLRTLGSNSATKVREQAQIRCCMQDSAHTCQRSYNYGQLPIAPYGAANEQPRDKPPIHLLQAGEGGYHLINGVCDKFAEKCWTCAILTSPDATCNE